MPKRILKRKPHSKEWKIFMSKLFKGRKFTPEWKEKISKANKIAYKGHPSPMAGKKHSKESKEKMSNSRKEYFKTHKHPKWKGGRFETDGYVYIYSPNHPYNSKKYILEHRLVVEKQIGRYLLPTEKAHHINKVKNDNRLNNLMVFINDSSHTRFEHNIFVKPEEIIFDGRKFIN